MKRWLFLILTLLLLLIGCIYVARASILAHLLSSKFQTSVSIKNLFFKPHQIALQDVCIANPKGFSAPSALKVASVSLFAPYRNYLDHVTSIDLIELSDLLLTIEILKKTTNWESLTTHLNQEKQTKSSSKEKSSYAIIKKLVIKDLTIEILKSGQKKTYHIRKLVLKNIQTKEGELIKHVTQAILNQLIYNIKNVIKIPLDMTNKALNNLFSTTKSFLPFFSSKKKIVSTQ